MVDAEKGVKIVITLFVGALMAAFLFPVVIGAMGGPDVATVTQNTTDTYEAQPGMNVTLDSVTAGSSATYTVTAGGDSSTTTVNVDANETVTVDGADVTIALQSSETGSATAEISSPTTYGWGSGASALWAIIPVMLVLAVFLFMVYTAMRQL